MEKKLFFSNSKGDRLSAILTIPKKENAPIILMAHGFATNKEGSTYVNLAELLADKGIASFRFDFFGHGKSEGLFAEITVEEAVDDVSQGINYLKEIGYKKIGLFGSSFGGLASLIIASQTDDLFVLVLKSPVSNYLLTKTKTMDKDELANWKKKGWRYYLTKSGFLKLNYTFFDSILRNDARKVAHKIKIPTLIIHGDKDEEVPIEQSIEISKIIPHCKLQIIKGANHSYSNTNNKKRMLRLASQFIISKS